MAAKYRYDPFGNLFSATGPLAAANLYRFSSKEMHFYSGMYYYGYRFYEPSLQRWINRDPIQDLGFVISTGRLAVRGASDRNAFLFVRNKVPNALDAFGLTLYYCTVPTSKLPPTFGIGRHGYLWNDTTGDECGQESFCGSGPTTSNNGGPGPNDTNPTRKGRVCTPIEGSDDDEANDELMSWCHAHANDGGWLPPFHDCHTVVNKCLDHGSLGGVDPGRFGQQPSFPPLDVLTGSIR
jgi:RHS repeat-associated protein